MFSKVVVCISPLIKICHFQWTRMVLSYSHIEFDVKVIVCVSPLLTSFSSASPLLPPSQWGAFMRRLAKKIGAGNSLGLMCRISGISYKS